MKLFNLGSLHIHVCPASAKRLRDPTDYLPERPRRNHLQVEAVHSKVVLSSRSNPRKKESDPAMPGGGGGMGGMGGMDF
jgi:hypothetical protein